MRGRDERGASSIASLARVVGLGALVVAAVVASYLALTRDTEPPAPSDSAQEQVPSPEPPSDDRNAVPEVADQLRQDFTANTELPPDARTSDNRAVGSPLTVRDGLLTHDAPQGPAASGSLEIQLAGPVQKIGGVVSIPKGNAGSAYLIGWAQSLVDARDGGQPDPKSGLRLEVDYGLWQLSVLDGTEVVIGGDEYEPSPGALQQFEVYRAGDRAWVVDPAGTVTIVQNPAIEALAGPWACWQLFEQTPREKPLGFTEIWAG